MNRRKAEGPDEIPIEFLKELDGNTIAKVNEILRKWWNSEDMEKEDTARVVTRVKIGNYRTISLLNSTYTIFTAMLVDSSG